MNGSTFFLAVNKTWSSSTDPCKLYTCKSQIAGETHIDIQQLACNTPRCASDFIYKTLPTECCGKCVSSICLADGKKFKAGDIWKSDDNCTVNECIDTGFDLVVTSYKKSCPTLKNCPHDSIEIRDCCPYCNFRRQSMLKFLFKVELKKYILNFQNKFSRSTKSSSPTATHIVHILALETASKVSH